MRKREIALTLAGTAVAFLLLNAAAGWLLRYRTPNIGYRLVRTKWEILQGLREPVDTLVLGDSAGNQAVVPSVLTEELGGRAVNLCSIGNVLAVNDAWMLKTYIDRFGPPQRVLLVHVWDGWGRGMERLRLVLMKVPLPWGFWARLEPRLSFSLPELWQLFLARYVPTYAENASLAMLLQHPTRLVRPPPQVIQPDGYMPVLAPDPVEVATDIKRHHRRARQGITKLEMSGLNREALALIDGLAERYGFAVYITEAPIHEELYQDPVFHGYFEQVRSAVRQVAGASRRLRYVPDAPLVFSTADMTNTDHLVHAASVKYTRVVAQEIRDDERFIAASQPAASAPR